MEMITDPVTNTAWWRPTIVDGKLQSVEIGDPCNSSAVAVLFKGTPYYVQPMWSNTTSGCAASLPTVTGVSPQAGPNVGGTTVQIQGGQFDTSGRTNVIFGGVQASDVKCTSTTCVATSPNEASGASSIVDVQVTVGPFTSYPSSSPLTKFTFLAGPQCKSEVTCQGVAFGFPNLAVTCPTSENFFLFPGTPAQQFLAAADSYTFDMNDVPHLGAACLPNGGSCTTFSLYEPSPTRCGSSSPPPPPNFCTNCQNTGGICTTASGGRKICVHE
jgi:hypothetical protein